MPGLSIVALGFSMVFAFIAVAPTLTVCFVVVRLAFQGPSRPRRRQRRS
jgi:hypothetical protein